MWSRELILTPETGCKVSGVFVSATEKRRARAAFGSIRESRLLDQPFGQLEKRCFQVDFFFTEEC